MSTKISIEMVKDDPKLLNEFLIENDKFVHYTVRKFYNDAVNQYDYSYDDLLQLGRIKLKDAVLGFDVSYGKTKFLSYASVAISNEIKVLLRKHRAKSRMLTNAISFEYVTSCDKDGSETTLGDTLSDGDKTDELCASLDTKEVLAYFFKGLNTRQKYILNLRSLGWTQKKIGDSLNLGQKAIHLELSHLKETYAFYEDNLKEMKSIIKKIKWCMLRYDMYTRQCITMLHIYKYVDKVYDMSAIQSMSVIACKLLEEEGYTLEYKKEYNARVINSPYFNSDSNGSEVFAEI